MSLSKAQLKANRIIAEAIAKATKEGKAIPKVTSLIDTADLERAAKKGKKRKEPKPPREKKVKEPKEKKPKKPKPRPVKKKK